MKPDIRYNTNISLFYSVFQHSVLELNSVKEGRKGICRSYTYCVGRTEALEGVEDTVEKEMVCSTCLELFIIMVILKYILCIVKRKEGRKVDCIHIV